MALAQMQRSPHFTARQLEVDSIRAGRFLLLVRHGPLTKWIMRMLFVARTTQQEPFNSEYSY